MKLTSLLLVTGVLFVLSPGTITLAQTNEVPATPPAKVKRGKAKAASGDEMAQLKATFKKEASRDRLPGLPDRAEFDFTVSLNDSKDVATFEVHPKEKSFVYHYEYESGKKKGAWKLKKAWRTDNENHVKEYPVD